MNLEKLDPRISANNRNKIESSGLLLEGSVNYAIQESNKILKNELSLGKSTESANNLVSQFLDQYYLKPQLDFEIYDEIWNKLSDSEFNPEFFNSLPEKDKTILLSSKQRINPILYGLFIKSVNFDHFYAKSKSQRFKYNPPYVPQNIYYLDGGNRFDTFIDQFVSSEKFFLKNSFGFAIYPVKLLKQWEKHPPKDLSKSDYILISTKNY